MQAVVKTRDLKMWTAILWTLRITVALQCLGIAWWFLQIEESPLLSYLWGQKDLGGLAWSESVALGVEHALGWMCLAMAPLVLLRPSLALLLPLVCLQLSIAAAMVQVRDGYQLPWGWAPEPVAALFPWLTQSARIAAPLSLAILDPWLARRPLSLARREAGIAVLRIAIAITFLAHGIEAWTHYFKFIDYNIMAIDNLFGWRMSQSTAEGLLTLMGGVDFVVALLVIAGRWLPAAYYMVFWGFVTATARLAVHGWELGWHEFATRAPHFGLPLAMAFYWQFIRPRISEEEREDDSSQSP